MHCLLIKYSLPQIVIMVGKDIFTYIVDYESGIAVNWCKMPDKVHKTCHY